jgi:hypothetical protein
VVVEVDEWCRGHGAVLRCDRGRCFHFKPGMDAGSGGFGFDGLRGGFDRLHGFVEGEIEFAAVPGFLYDRGDPGGRLGPARFRVPS